MKGEQIMFKKNLKRAVTIAMTACLMVGAAAGCGNSGDDKSTPTPTTAATNDGQSSTSGTDNQGSTNTDNESSTTEQLTVETFEGEYVYKDSVVTLSANWNPHRYQTSDESYPIGYLTSGLYDFIFNDELNPVEGKDAYKGYVIVPEMAASMPVDVTEKVKAEHPEFNIPASATAGYAYTIDLNPLATWEDGTKIDADTYVYSMKALLDPKMQNYRATDKIDGDFVVANGKNYYYQGTSAFGSLGKSVTDYLANGGNVDDIWVDMSFWGVTAADGTQYAKATDDTMVRDEAVAEGEPEDYVSAKYLYDTYLGAGCPYESYSSQYLGTMTVYEDNFPYEKVGLYKTGDYQITLVLEKSLAGFDLLYNLTSNWIVYEKYYEACKSQIGETGAWTSTYNTSVETTMSYGPYKMVSYQTDKAMRFEKNENWYGHTDGKHIYKDPVDGKIYPMYQTTAIDCQVVAEAATRKLMFLKGQLMDYVLQSDDFAEYRDSEFCYVTPSETIFFFIFNGYMDAIKERENHAEFDKATKDLETITLTSFRKAVAVTYDKEALCTAVQPARSGGYGLIGNNYIYDPETGAKYRDTDQAKQALCDFYSVDVSKFASLDDAVDSITGYDVEAARKLYTQAFEEAIAAGYITDADGDGKSDQTIEITYAASAVNDFINKTMAYLNEKMAEVVAGTPFEGKITFVASAPLGNTWSDNIKAGLSDTVLAGWSGSALNPFSLTDLYVNPTKQYDAKWFNSETISSTMTINGESITMNLKQWSDALNGTTVTVNGKEYCFGSGIADVETRLNILAMLEGQVLSTYDYIPMIQDASMELLSQQVYYVIEDYNPILGRGGIAYMKYNYDEAGWTEYINSQSGQLSY